MLQNKLILCDNLPKRMIETKEKEADRMVAEDTLMYKQGVMDEKVDMIRSLRDENISISALAKASKLSEDEVLRILSEE